ncbi:hypothetical protein ACFXJ8_19740 [Nonomuraea sp. NPDC059194]|uniref:hypothetical protein n=1 Tax=Nonomuraea sp. NPDC059194 TaxID=3346764 RepID=UPI00367BCA4F
MSSGYDSSGEQSPYGSGAQSPYGQQQPYGSPYNQGQSPYGHPQPGYGYGYPPPPQQQGPRTHAIVALVISIVLALSCYITPGGIAGAILAGIALGQVDTMPDKARNLLKWTWISIGINVALVILGVGTIIALGVSGNLD